MTDLSHHGKENQKIYFCVSRVRMLLGIRPESKLLLTAEGTRLGKLPADLIKFFRYSTKGSWIHYKAKPMKCDFYNRKRPCVLILNLYLREFLGTRGKHLSPMAVDVMMPLQAWQLWQLLPCMGDKLGDVEFPGTVLARSLICFGCRAHTKDLSRWLGCTHSSSALWVTSN